MTTPCHICPLRFFILTAQKRIQSRVQIWSLLHNKNKQLTLSQEDYRHLVFVIHKFTRLSCWPQLVIMLIAGFTLKHHFFYIKHTRCLRNTLLRHMNLSCHYSVSAVLEVFPSYQDPILTLCAHQKTLSINQNLKSYTKNKLLLTHKQTYSCSTNLNLIFTKQKQNVPRVIFIEAAFTSEMGEFDQIRRLTRAIKASSLEL